jgi:hypothetical protein
MNIGKIGEHQGQTKLRQYAVTAVESTALPITIVTKWAGARKK